MATGVVLLVTHVEDERVMYSEALRVAGFRVLCPKSEDDVSTLAVRDRPVAIVTRVHPRGAATNGLSLVRRLKRDAATSHIPIVIISSLTQLVDREEALAAGGDSYLLLPAFPDALVLAVQRVVQEQHRTATSG